MDKFKYIDNLFESRLEGAEFTPDKSAWNNISSKLDEIYNSKDYINKRNRRIKLFSAASVVFIAISSILLIRSCENLPAQSNAKYNFEYANTSQSNYTPSTVLSNSSLSVGSAIQKGNIHIQNELDGSATKNNSVIESENPDIFIADKYIASKNSKNNLNNNSTNLFESDKTSNGLALEKLSKFAPKQLIFNNKLEIQNSLTKFETLHKLFNFGKSKSKELSFELSYGSNILRNNYIINNNLYNHSTSKYHPGITDYNISANIKYEVNKFFIKTGINYSTLNEIDLLSFNEQLNDTSASHYTYDIHEYITYDSVDWWINPDNPYDTLVYYEPILNQDTINMKWNRVDSLYDRSYQKTIETNLRYIEIPMIFGYKQQFNRFAIGVLNGIGIAFKVGDEGYLIQNDEIIQITRANSPYNDMIINYIAGIDFSYKINRNISIFVNPQYKTNLTSIFKNQAINNKQIHSFGINAGLNFVIK